jgi:hypothetical protein
MLKQFIQQNREALLQKWIDHTFNTYQPEMVRFLKAEKDQFSNPVRNTIITSSGNIYDAILEDTPIFEINGLEEIIKVRAVQDFSPSDALSFLFNLKNIIQTEYIKDKKNAVAFTELYEFNERFDKLVLKAFDIYNDCRLKIQEIKMAEIKSRSERAFEILNKK